MPFLGDECPVSFGEFLRLRKFTELQSMRFAEFDGVFNIEHGLPVGITHMDMDGLMVVAVKEKSVTVFLEDNRHLS